MEITIILASRQQHTCELLCTWMGEKHIRNQVLVFNYKIYKKGKAGKDKIYSRNIAVKNDIFRPKTIQTGFVGKSHNM